MKKILVALAAALFACTGAEAQTRIVKEATIKPAKTPQGCPEKHDKVCRVSPVKNVRSCYKTRYNSNFKVCKGDAGYFICCEKPNPTNSTNPQGVAAAAARRSAAPQTQVYTWNKSSHYAQNACEDMHLSLVAPQNQSYPCAAQPISASSFAYYRGYYPRKGKIKVCYYGDNVAELNKNPYEGCNAPAFDGIDKNNERNLNVANPINLPPLAGNPYFHE